MYRTYQRITSWFKEDVFRRLLLNSGKLLSASGLAAILGFFATVLVARSLGPETYGLRALVLVYVQIMGQLVTFSAWQAVIKYGSERLLADDRDGLRQLFKFGFSLDISTAIIGTCLAIGLSGPVSEWLGWSQSLRSMLVTYSFLILFTLNGTPIGILRLFNRFDLLSYALILTALASFGGILWCVGSGQELMTYIVVYLFTSIVGQLLQIFAALWELSRQQLGGFAGQSLKGFHSKFPGIWQYIWTSNINQTIRMISRQMDELTVAGLISPADLGLYKIAKQFSRILPMLTDPLYQSIYPELTKLWASDNKDGFVSLIKRSTLLVSFPAILGWSLYILFGKWLITVTVGVEYLNVYGTAVVYMFAVIIATCTFSFAPAILAIGKPTSSLKALAIATVVYLIALVPLLRMIGIIGASLSYVVFYLTWSLLIIHYLQSHFSMQRKKS